MVVPMAVAVALTVVVAVVVEVVAAVAMVVEVPMTMVVAGTNVDFRGRWVYAGGIQHNLQFLLH
jgi:hypothetical protein